MHCVCIFTIVFRASTSNANFRYITRPQIFRKWPAYACSRLFSLASIAEASCRCITTPEALRKCISYTPGSMNSLFTDQILTVFRPDFLHRPIFFRILPNILLLKCLVFLKGFWRFWRIKKVREPRRTNFHLVSCKSDSMVPSLWQKELNMFKTFNLASIKVWA